MLRGYGFSEGTLPVGYGDRFLRHDKSSVGTRQQAVNYLGMNGI